MKKNVGTPSPLFPMETDSGAEEYISRIVTPIFEKVAKEMKKTPLWGVPRKEDKQKKYCLYNPHNYRLYFLFKSPKKWKEDIYKPHLNGVFKPHLKSINKGNEFFLEDFCGCSFRITRKTIVVTHKENEWHKIDISAKAESQIHQIILTKDLACINALQQFILNYGGTSSLAIAGRYSENKIKQEDFIDTLPIKEKWHTDIYKKVYNEPTVEFYDPSFASNYITNRSIEEITPKIQQALYTANPLRALKQLIKSPADIIAYPQLVSLLTQDEMREIENWIFKSIS